MNPINYLDLDLQIDEKIFQRPPLGANKGVKPAVAPYSSEWEPANLLMKKLYDQGFSVDLKEVSPANDPTRKEWLCLITKGQKSAEVFEKTGPLALSIAALKMHA